MGVGMALGALLGMAAGAAGLTLLGFTVGTMWILGASLGSLFDMASMSTPSTTYTLDPISNPMAELIPVPVLYGKTRTAGNIFYQQFYDSDRKTVYQHVAVSEGPLVSGGLAAGNVMANDQDCANLDTLEVEVFQGTSNQAASTWDPEGLAYPFLAYAAIKISASSKLQGTPTITVVARGRDIDYPGKASTTAYLAAQTSASSGNNTTKSFEGYKDDTRNCHAIGYSRVCVVFHPENDSCLQWLITYYPSMGILSDFYSNLAKDQIVCIPFAFNDNGSQLTVDVFPDSTLGVYYRFTLTASEAEEPFTKSLENGVALHWELRHVEDGDFAGVLYAKVPVDLLPASGRAKIFFQSVGNPPPKLAGLLPYTDILSDSPWTGFDNTGSYNNPVWCIYDLLTNSRYGCGLPEAWFDLDSFSEVAMQCEEEGIELNYIVDSQKPIVDLLQEMLAVCRGWLNFRDLVRIGMDKAVISYSRVLTADDIFEGSFSYWTTALDERPNRIILEYVDGVDDGDGTWETVTKTREDWDDIQVRGAYEKRISVNGVTGNSQARALLNYMWEIAHRCVTYCSFRTGLHNSDIEVGDVVSVTYDLPGWTEKWMRVIGVEDDPEGFITLTCLEYDEAVYDTSDDV